LPPDRIISFCAKAKPVELLAEAGIIRLPAIKQIEELDIAALQDLCD
jgi:hypothetical protein